MEFIERYKKQIMFLVLAVIFIVIAAEKAGFGELLKGHRTESQTIPKVNIKQFEKEKSHETTVAVYISGEVIKPGVYCLSSHARIADALQLAGGLSKRAAQSYVNLAAKISDGQHIHFPSSKELRDGLPDSASQSRQNDQEFSLSSRSTTSKKVNINTASQGELETLSGIGPATATKILDYRTQHGRFASLDDLKNISGIGDKKVEAISDEATVQ